MSRRRKSSIQTPPPPSPAQVTPLVASVSPETATPRSLFQLPRWGKIAIGVTGVTVGLILVIITWRGFWTKRDPDAVAKARRMLQINRPRLAIEALANEVSAEGHYLKAVALQNIGQGDAAREQITEARSIDPYDTKYEGYELLLQMSKGRPEAVEELIELYQLRPSSTGLAFFATRAFTKRKPPDIRSALSAFELGTTLIDETPEFMFNAMVFAIKGLQSAAPGAEKLQKEKVDAAVTLLTKLEQVAPKDPDLLKELLSWSVQGKLVEQSQHLLERLTELKANSPELTELKVMVELMLGRSEAAIATAKQAVSDNPGDPTVELMLAEAVWQSSATPEHQQILADLITKHPENPEFVAKLALYLAKDKRLAEAVEVVNTALAKTKAPAQRAALLKLAVGIPLEANNPVLSEQQVSRYKNEFNNPKLVDYFEGRVLFLKKEYTAAKTRFQKVVQDLQINNDSDQKLAAECLFWQQKILQIEILNAEREAATHAVESTSKKLETKKAEAKKSDQAGDLPIKTVPEK